MGKQGVAIESGCCKSTGRVPVIEQSEYESANEALVRAGIRNPGFETNETSYAISCDIAYDIISKSQGMY